MNSLPAVFVTLTKSRVTSLCRRATRRIALAAPGVSVEVAREIVAAYNRKVIVRVVLDCNDDVCRMGYGEIEAVRILANAGISVGQTPGLRTGVFIVDNNGWSFSPTPLSVEPERQSPETPNAVALAAEQITAIMIALGQNLDVDSQTPLFPAAAAEIGNTELTEMEIAAAEKSLAEVPPIPFDLQRQVRVFQPYIQYVELSLEGASIRRQTVALPASLAPLAKSEQVQKRLRTTYSLISENSKINDKPLHDELNSIRKDFAHHISALSGNVMLRGKQAALEARFAALEKKVEKYKETLGARLDRELGRSLSQLKQALLPLVLGKPPRELLNGCLGDTPTRDEADRWLNHELQKAFPDLKTILRDIELKKTYKDVTYSSLNNTALRDELKRAFPAVAWDKPFEEFDAAKAATSGRKRSSKQRQDSEMA